MFQNGLDWRDAIFVIVPLQRFTIDKSLRSHDTKFKRVKKQAILCSFVCLTECCPPNAFNTQVWYKNYVITFSQLSLNR